MRLEETRDVSVIRAVMTHPRLWPWLSHDFSPSAAEFWPSCTPGVHYLEARSDQGELLGLCIAHALNPVCWEVDHAILPHAWGATAIAIGRALGHWVWDNTDAQTVVGMTPSDNRLACRYAQTLGMVETGRIPKAFQRRGLLHDLVIFTQHRSN